MFERFTNKQKEFIKDIIQGKTKRINILEGSVRSGKTYISLIAWLIMLTQYKDEKNYLMVGKTLTSLKRNCLSLLESICPCGTFYYSIAKKEANIFGKKIFLEGVNDMRAEHKIRGMTLQAAYCDEITLFTEDFFSMLLTRLSLDGACLLGTTNPDTPTHWLMKKFLSRKNEISLKSWRFLLDDNDTINENIRNDMKREYTGVFYKRFILGDWVQAEGLIYDEFANNSQKYINDGKEFRGIENISIGIDYGASRSKTAFVAVGFRKCFSELLVLEEEEITGVNIPEVLYSKIINFYNKVRIKHGSVNGIYADWGGLGQIITKGLKVLLIHENIGVKTFDCKKIRIMDRIQLLNRLISTNRFFVSSACKQTVEALKTAIWDTRKEDTRLDDGTSDIDILDALEYAYSPYINILNNQLNVREHEHKMLIV